jgi:hypothetical protein
VDMVALFCDLDDFYQAFVPARQKQLLPAPGQHRRRACDAVGSFSPFGLGERREVGGEHRNLLIQQAICTLDDL